MKPSGLLRLFGALLVLSLAKYLLLAAHAHPVADDFCYAAKSHGLSLWDWSFSEWLYWNGRYASNLLMIHGPLTWSSDLLTGYRMMPVLLLLSTFLSFWFFLHRATGHALSTGREMIGALVFLLLYLNLMPDLGEGFYWYTGAITYQLGSILLMVHLGLLFGKHAGWKRAIALLLNIVLAVVITGMDEIHMLLMLGLHAGRFAWLVRKRSGLVPGLLLLGVVGGGAAVMYLAPGNAVRGGMFANTHLFWRSLGMSALQAVRFVGAWVLSPALLASSVVHAVVHPELKKRIPAYNHWLGTPPLLAAALPILLVMACTFPAYWSTGLLGQHRTVNVACLFFLPAWFLQFSLWLERKPLRRMAGAPPRGQVLGAALLLTILGLNFTRNGLAAYADLISGRASTYDGVMMAREAEVRRVAGEPGGHAAFTRLASPPLTLPSYEDRGPLRGWMMDCEARFFGAKDGQVTMADEGTEPGEKP